MEKLTLNRLRASCRDASASRVGMYQVPITWVRRASCPGSDRSSGLRPAIAGWELSQGRANFPDRPSKSDDFITAVSLSRDVHAG